MSGNADASPTRPRPFARARGRGLRGLPNLSSVRLFHARWSEEAHAIDPCPCFGAAPTTDTHTDLGYNDHDREELKL